MAPDTADLSVLFSVTQETNIVPPVWFGDHDPSSFVLHCLNMAEGDIHLWIHLYFMPNYNNALLASFYLKIDGAPFILYI